MRNVKGLIEFLSPAALGPAFRRIFAAATFANLGDGIVFAAGPLLVAALTADPFLVALAPAVQQLPWLLLSLPVGAIGDRVSRKTLVIFATLARLAFFAVLAAFLLTGTIMLPVLYVVLFLVGCAEVVSDVSWSALIPDVVPAEHLAAANVRLSFSFQTLNQLIGPVVGAALFAIGAAVPYLSNVLLYAAASITFLAAVVPKPSFETTGAIATRSPWQRVRYDISSGLKYTFSHAPVRTLVVLIAAFNVSFGMTFGVQVLYVTDYLGANEQTYGLVVGAGAVGGLFGVALFGWLAKRMSYTVMMKLALTLEVASHLAFALNRSVWGAAIILLVIGTYASVWGILSQTIRGRVTAAKYRGRVASVNLFGIFGGNVLGVLLGGAIGSWFGFPAPMWAAFVLSAITLALLWRALSHLGRANDESLGGASQ